jgi:multiple sugar transport system permease protein
MSTGPAATSSASTSLGYMRRSPAGMLLTALTLIAAALWFFPIYWAIATSLRADQATVKDFGLIPADPTLDGYLFAILHSNLPTWYLNSTITSVATTVLVILLSASTGYAISQLRFPGRLALWWTILASFMVPVTALIVNHFIIMADIGLLNSYPGIVLPMLLNPVTVIVYKQFFDGLPKEFREAAVMDGATEMQLFYRVFLPMNWGVTTALAIITFIGAWNAFLWPFLVVQNEKMMTVTVGVTAVQDAYGVAYGRILAGAVLASLPVALAYLFFQRRVTQAIALSAGIKG